MTLDLGKTYVVCVSSLAPRRAALPRAEHLIDWFHVVISQMTKGLRSRDNPELRAEALEELERLKWFLWHGNVLRALQTVDNLQIVLDYSEHPSPDQQKLLKTVTEFAGYIRADGAWIPNYGEWYRSGEAMLSAFVEWTGNQVVSKRMVKKQQISGHPRVLTCCCTSVPGS